MTGPLVGGTAVTGPLVGAAVVPAYFHPAVAAAEWRVLAAGPPGIRAVVLNIDDGPGTAPQPLFEEAASRVAVPMVGYVDTNYGARNPASIQEELTRWRAWYPVRGVFLDRVATDRELAPWYGRLSAYARWLGLTTVIANHGAHPDPDYAEIADVLVTFEGPYAAHRRVAAPAWVRDQPADRFCHLVYDTTAALVDEVLARAAREHAGNVYVTDRSGVNPWSGLPVHVHRQVMAGEPGVALR